MSRFIDFDEMWKEAEQKEEDRPRIKAFGEEIVLPVMLPAKVMLESIRFSADDDDTNALDRVESIIGYLAAFVGRERVQRWIDDGASPAMLLNMFTHIVGLYTPSTDDDGEGNETAPKTGAQQKESSKSGA